jgi:hypothetical protein
MKRQLVALATAMAFSVAGPGGLWAEEKPPSESKNKPAPKTPTKDESKKPGDGNATKAPERAEYAAEVMVLHATNSKKGIDERIGEMPELRQPPFSSYDSYQLLNKARLPLAKGKPRTFLLPNRRVLRTELIDILPEDYLRISASINQPNGKDFLPLLEVKAKLLQPFIVAGQSYKKGILVLVIRVVK